MTTIQIRNAGRMWHVYINGACRAFSVTFLAAQHRADQLLAQLEAEHQGGAA